MPATETDRLLQRLIAEGEREWVEFKTSWFEPARVGRYVSALGNGARLEDKPNGYLVWGVSNEGAVVGTGFSPDAERVGEQPFEFWLKGRVTPKGHGLHFIQTKYKDLRVVLLEIDAADGVPVRFDGSAYIRVGQATPKLEDHPDREKRLMKALVHTSFESDWALENVTDEEIFELLDVEGALRLLTEQPMSEEAAQLDQLRGFRLIEPTGGNFWAITNRAAVLFANRLGDFGDRFERRAARVVFYEGDSRVKTRREQIGGRGYALGFESLFDWLDAHLPRSEHLRGVLREDRPIYPLVSLRELVANALIHQDFSIKGAGPMIELFDHRVEISNPGVPLIHVDRLIDEPPRSRNERLASLMRRMGYCEERGSGIDKVIFGAEIYQLPPPAFEVKTNGFVATMFAPRSFKEMTTEERLRACYQNACLLWVSGGDRLTNSTLRKRFGLSANRTSQVSRLIADAVEAGLIKAADPTNRSKAQASYQPYWA